MKTARLYGNQQGVSYIPFFVRKNKHKALHYQKKAEKYKQKGHFLRLGVIFS